MPPADRYRPIIFTDDASVLSVNEPPLSLDRVREQMIEPLEGTPASLWWSVGDHEVFHHETEIGEIIGDGVDDFEKYEYFHSFSAAQFKRVSDNTRHLIADDRRPADNPHRHVPRGRHRVLPPGPHEQPLPQGPLYTGLRPLPP